MDHEMQNGASGREEEDCTNGTMGFDMRGGWVREERSGSGSKMLHNRAMRESTTWWQRGDEEERDLPRRRWEQGGEMLSGQLKTTISFIHLGAVLKETCRAG